MKKTKKTKIIEKGYLLEVESWENDGDNSKRQSMNFKTKEEAVLVFNLCKTLFKSNNDKEKGIGNLMDDEDDIAKGIIINYLIKNPEILKIKGINFYKSLKRDVMERFDDATEDDWKGYISYFAELEEDNETIVDSIEIVREYNQELMGYSEYYYSRVFEKAELFYSDKDVYVESVMLAVR